MPCEKDNQGCYVNGTTTEDTEPADLSEQVDQKASEVGARPGISHLEFQGCAAWTCSESLLETYLAVLRDRGWLGVSI